jgi:hypothetical protein
MNGKGCAGSMASGVIIGKMSVRNCSRRRSRSSFGRESMV